LSQFGLRRIIHRTPKSAARPTNHGGPVTSSNTWLMQRNMGAPLIVNDSVMLFLATQLLVTSDQKVRGTFATGMFAIVSMGAFAGISTFTSVTFISFTGFDESSDRNEITSFRDMLSERQGDKGAEKWEGEAGQELKTYSQHNIKWKKTDE
jgi:hypothetical protein